MGQKIAALPGAPEGNTDKFDRAYRYMKCALTLSLQEIWHVKIVPLNEPPNQSQQLEQVVLSGKPALLGYLGEDYGLGKLMDNQEMLEKIHKCDGVLPLSRKPLSDFEGSRCQSEEKESKKKSKSIYNSAITII